MPIYTLQGPDGKTYDIEGPAGATAADLAAVVERQGTKPYDVPSWKASLMNVGQAMSFGFGDEIAAKFGADKGRYNATVEKFRKDYPEAALVGSLSGGLAVPLGVGSLAVRAPYQAAAITGAGVGALQGAGDAPTMESAPRDAIMGSATGMLGGLGILGTMNVGGNLAGALLPKVPGLRDMVAENIARRRVAHAFERDQIPLNTVDQQMQELGAEARLADVGGQSVRTQLDLQANMPGQTAQQLETVIRNRIAQRPDRMDDIVYRVSRGMGRAKSLTEALEAQQRATAGPLYQQAHSMDIAPSPTLINALEAAKKLGAFAEAEKRSLANPSNGPFTLGASQQALGGGRIAIRDIDHIKRGIDSLIDKETDQVTGKVTGYGRDLVALKNRLLSEADAATINPQTGESIFRAARQAFAGPEALKTAITRGKAFWHEEAGRLEDIVQGMSPSELQAFHVGAAEALRTKFGGQSGQTQFLNAWKDRNVREKLQAVLGDDVTYQDVMRVIRSEETLKRLEGLGPGRNSRTASRLAAGEDQEAQIAADIINTGIAAKTGGILPLAAKGLSKLASGNLVTTEPVRDAIGNILLRQYAPAEIQALIRAQEAMRRAQGMAAGASGTVAGQSGMGKGLLE